MLHNTKLFFTDVLKKEKDAGILVLYQKAFVVQKVWKERKDNRMDYKEFIELMKNEVKLALGEAVEVECYEATKNNEVKRVGLVLKSAKIPISPTIYMEEFYKQYSNGSSIPELVKSIEDLYQRVKVTDSYPYEDILDYQSVKKKLAYKLINKKQNRERLREIPHEDFFDMAIVPYVMFESFGFGCATMQIRMEHLKKWNVDEKTVLEDAKVNAEDLLPVEIGRLTECMYVITNVNHSMGASALCYSGVLEHMGKVMKENFYALPSSIHEFIIVPESFVINECRLRSTVSEMNEIAVTAEEVLSDHVCYYDLKTKKLMQK